MNKANIQSEITTFMARCKDDWNLFAKEVLGADLDPDQQQILSSIQYNSKVSVVSGNGRGKDFVASVAALCFHYLTPKFDTAGNLVSNSKTILTAPTDRQCLGIMMPEISRLYHKMCSNGFSFLGGRLNSSELKMEQKEWFLTSFVADEYNPEAWAGWHANAVFFVCSEASAISDSTFNVIEGNLQGNNSKLLLVFNYNQTTGYAADSLHNKQFKSFRLDSLTAPNVLQRKEVVPGQVNWEWINGRVHDWCMRIEESQYLESEGDFEWLDEDGEKAMWRPNDLFRVKVRALPARVSSDVLIPRDWIEAANKRWREYAGNAETTKSCRMGVDAAGLGRDFSSLCFRYGNYVKKFEMFKSMDHTSHMQLAGRIKFSLDQNRNVLLGIQPKCFIDTIGEGSGVYSRLVEQNVPYVYSCKFSESAEDENGKPVTDITGQYSFLNMRAALYWKIRDWLNPANKSEAMLPPDEELAEELTKTRWEFMSNGKVKIEAKDEIKKRIKRSPDRADSLANTFFPVEDFDPEAEQKKKDRLRHLGNYFH